jgi:hypothetical protein
MTKLTIVTDRGGKLIAAVQGMSFCKRSARSRPKFRSSVATSFITWMSISIWPRSMIRTIAKEARSTRSQVLKQDKGEGRAAEALGDSDPIPGARLPIPITVPRRLPWPPPPPSAQASNAPARHQFRFRGNAREFAAGGLNLVLVQHQR